MQDLKKYKIYKKLLYKVGFIMRYNIFIVLTQTKTYPARVIRLYTNEPYAHASIAFDENLDEMYSFARRECIIHLTPDLLENILIRVFLDDLILLLVVYIGLI